MIEENTGSWLLDWIKITTLLILERDQLILFWQKITDEWFLESYKRLRICVRFTQFIQHFFFLNAFRRDWIFFIMYMFCILSVILCKSAFFICNCKFWQWIYYTMQWFIYFLCNLFFLSKNLTFFEVSVGFNIISARLRTVLKKDYLTKLVLCQIKSNLIVFGSF